MVGIRSMKTKREIDSMELRQLCIDNDYYTMGDVEAYDELLTYVRHKDITDTDVIAIADNIYNHTDIERFMKMYGCGSDEVFDSIYFNVGSLVKWFSNSSTF